LLPKSQPPTTEKHEQQGTNQKTKRDVQCEKKSLKHKTDKIKIKEENMMRNGKKKKEQELQQQQQNSQQLPILHYSNKHSTIQLT
jgi:hypothetical protein